MNFDWITPDWPVPSHVQSVITTRQGGVSITPFTTMNLAAHVNDDDSHMSENRRILMAKLDLTASPFWLTQIHGCTVADATVDKVNCEADAVFTHQIGQACVVLTADCLPLLMCDTQGTQVAAIHAGWRGLQQGIIEQTIDRFHADAHDIMVWLGPAISSKAFEVGNDVRDAFIQSNPEHESAFSAIKADKWMGDLYQLARQRLSHKGIGYVGGGDYCTYNDAQRFYSYRREGVTGRMASLIWLNPK